MLLGSEPAATMPHTLGTAWLSDALGCAAEDAFWAGSGPPLIFFMLGMFTGTGAAPTGAMRDEEPRAWPIT